MKEPDRKIDALTENQTQNLLNFIKADNSKDELTKARDQAMIYVLFLMFGMTDNINPEALLWITVAGWPVGTMIFLFIRLSMDM